MPETNKVYTITLTPVSIKVNKGGDHLKGELYYRVLADANIACEVVRTAAIKVKDGQLLTVSGKAVVAKTAKKGAFFTVTFDAHDRDDLFNGKDDGGTVTATHTYDTGWGAGSQTLSVVTKDFDVCLTYKVDVN